MQLLSDLSSAPAVATATEPDPRNLIINYIPTPVTDAGLRKLFESFGTIESARVIVDRVTNHPKGYGFVKYTTEEAAKRAMQKMNGYEIGNKRLRVTRANGPQNRTQPPPPPPPPPHGLSMCGLVGNMNTAGGGAGAGYVGVMGSYTVSSATAGSGGGNGSHNLTDASSTLPPPPPPLFSSQLWSYVPPATFASPAMLPTSTGTATCAATTATSTAATAPLPPPPPPPPPPPSTTTTTTTMPPFLTPGYTMLGANGQLYRGPFFATTATGMPAMFMASPAGVTAPLSLLTQQQQQQQQQLQQQLALLSAAPATMSAGLSAPLLYKMDGTPVKLMDNGVLQPVFAPYQVNNNNNNNNSTTDKSTSGGGGATTSAANKSAGDYSNGNAEATLPLSASTLNILSSFGLPANFLSYGGMGGNAAVVGTSPVDTRSTSAGNGGDGSNAGKTVPAIGRTNSNNNNEDDGSGNNDGTSDGVSVSASAASPVTTLRPLCFAPFQPGSPLNEVMQQSGYQVSMGASSLSMLNSGYSCDMTPPTHMQSSAMVLPTGNGNKACGNNNNNASSDLVTLM